MAREKKNSLQAALDGLPASEQDIGEVAGAPATGAVESKAPAKTKRPTVMIGGHFDPDYAKQLNMIAAEEGRKKQDLLAEALNLLFVKKGKERIL